MSDYTAIRGVTLSLKTLLDDGLNIAPPPPDRLGVSFTASRPDVKQTVTGNRLNLFLYQVVENHCMANQEDPRIGTTRDYGHPPLSLNLHYLLTPFSTDTDETEAHRILGAVMRILHDNALLLPSSLTSTAQPILDTSLLGALEHLRISLLPLTLDDLSKVWFGSQESLRLSVAYEVTVVQIDSLRPRRAPLPVKDRNVVVSLGNPRITSIVPDAVGIGDALTITGSGFFSATTRVFVGTVPIALSGLGAPTLQDHSIRTSVPNDASLWPGIQMVRVQVGFDESNAVATSAFPQVATSNVVPIALVPKLTSISPPGAPQGSSHVLTINGERLYRAEDASNIYVLIGDQTIPSSQFSVKTATQVQLTVPDFTPGRYAVYLRFDAFTSLDDVEFEVT
ncbi:MAG TPA: DUF4255 domain-containing protein [Anaerolineales bacterium]|nr:DUF4255 domain-containing protein [Anaerolineales bacterium]